MKWMACDTSSKYLVLVAAENDHLLKGKVLPKPFEHTRDLIPQVRKFLSELKWKVSDVECFAFGKGPGSYTGLRVGLVALKALSLTTDAKLVLFSSLAAVGFPWPRKLAQGWVVVDAKRSKFYARSADLSPKGMKWTSEDLLLSAEEWRSKVTRQSGSIYVASDAKEALQWPDQPKKLTWLKGKANFPTVRGVFEAAYSEITHRQFVSCSEVLPAYMRLSEAEETLKKK